MPHHRPSGYTTVYSAGSDDDRSGYTTITVDDSTDSSSTYTEDPGYVVRRDANLSDNWALRFMAHVLRGPFAGTSPKKAKKCSCSCCKHDSSSCTSSSSTEIIEVVSPPQQPAWTYAPVYPQQVTGNGHHVAWADGGAAAVRAQYDQYQYWDPYTQQYYQQSSPRRMLQANEARQQPVWQYAQGGGAYYQPAYEANYANAW